MHLARDTVTGRSGILEREGSHEPIWAEATFRSSVLVAGQRSDRQLAPMRLEDIPAARRLALVIFFAVMLLTWTGVIPPHDAATAWELR